MNESEKILEGRMGIGPETGEEAIKIWGEIQEKRLGLEDLVSNYRTGKPLEGSSFHKMVSQLKVPFTQRAGGLLVLTALEGLPREIVTEEAQAKAAQDPVLKVLKSASCVLVPLKSRDGKVVGVIFADNLITRKPITREAFRLLAILAAHAGLAIENARLYETARQQAAIDSLTQLWNRGAFDRFLMESLAEAERNRLPISLLLVDLDHFKEYNDQVGHMEGDQALIRIAKLLKENARAADQVARYGGEEFALILPETSKLNALKLAERLRVNMDRTGLPLTLSAGVATFPSDAQSPEKLLKAADRALYEAKHLGRNRVVIA
jgi:diguanylate cyclase (GGDEF)-like protein